MDPESAQRQWAAQARGLLGTRKAEKHAGNGAEKQASGGQAPIGPLVAFRHALLSWRTAQKTLQENLTALGSRVLGHPEVQADPRFAQIKQAIGQFSRVVPAFGTRLDDLLDAGLSAADAAEQSRLSAQTVQVIYAYQQQLAAAKPLLQLEQFASQELSADLPLHGALQDALNDIRQRLAA